MNQGQNNKSEEEKAVVKITGATDLLGLSIPLRNIIVTVSKALGATTAAWLLKRNSRATAEATRTLDDALKRSGLSPVAGDLSIEKRAQVRVTYEQLREQRNIESVLGKSYAYLADNSEKLGTDEMENEPDEDWLTRFFYHAREVSNELMQHLWGKVLAEEIRSPGSFTLRSLDTLRLMTRNDADRFRKICQVAYVHANTAGVLLPNNMPFRKGYSKYVDSNDIKLLETFDLFYSDGLLGQFQPGAEDGVCSFTINNYRITLSLGDKTKFDIAAHWRMTPLGMEIMQVVEKENNEEYIRFITNMIIDKGYKVESIQALPNFRLHKDRS